MASKSLAPYAVLLLRLVTLALLTASLAIIARDNYTDDVYYALPRKFTFKDIYAYRYVLAIATIGCAYTLLQVPFAAVSIARGKRIVCGADNVAVLLLVFADVVAAQLLATGAAAGFGFTYDAKRENDRWFHEIYWIGAARPDVTRLYQDTYRFLTLAFTSAGLMLWAAACEAITSMVSVYLHVK